MYPLSKYSFLRHVAAASPVFSYVGFNANRSNTVNMPAGIQAGDMAIHFSGGGGIGSFPYGLPSGFTMPPEANGFFDQGGSASYRFIGSYKILTGSETSIAGCQHVNAKQWLVVFRKSPSTSNWLTPVFEMFTQTYPDYDNPLVSNGTVEISSQPTITVACWNTGGQANSTWNPVEFSPTQTGLLANTQNGGAVDMLGGYIIQNTSQANVYVSNDKINPDSGLPNFPYFRSTAILGAL